MQKKKRKSSPADHIPSMFKLSVLSFSVHANFSSFHRRMLPFGNCPLATHRSFYSPALTTQHKRAVARLPLRGKGRQIPRYLHHLHSVLWQQQTAENHSAKYSRQSLRRRLDMKQSVTMENAGNKLPRAHDVLTNDSEEKVNLTYAVRPSGHAAGGIKSLLNQCVYSCKVFAQTGSHE